MLTFSRHFRQSAGSQCGEGGGARGDNTDTPPSSDGTGSEGTGSSEDVSCRKDQESDRLLDFVRYKVLACSFKCQ